MKPSRLGSWGVVVRSSFASCDIEVAPKMAEIKVRAGRRVGTGGDLVCPHGSRWLGPAAPSYPAAWPVAAVSQGLEDSTWLPDMQTGTSVVFDCVQGLFRNEVHG